MASNATPAASRDTCGMRFGAFIEYARDVFLQDACLKFHEYPEHRMFHQNAFMSTHWFAFHRWRDFHMRAMHLAEDTATSLFQPTLQIARTYTGAINNMLCVRDNDREVKMRKKARNEQKKRMETFFQRMHNQTMVVSVLMVFLHFERTRKKKLYFCVPIELIVHRKTTII